ncbi:MAG: NTPase [Methanosarcinales archaeon Met12]|nr:MAG: NTPase [Methanosarcinales archaeon Met12]
MNRIAITGPPRIGKTTICRRVIDSLGCRVGGMSTSEIRDGDRIGFQIMDLMTGMVGTLAHVHGAGPRIGKYHVNLADLDNIGAKAIECSIDAERIVIDEIGPMELKSERFVRAVEMALNSNKPMLVTLHQRSRHSLAERIRSEFEVREITKENRDRIVYEITEKLKT